MSQELAALLAADVDMVQVAALIKKDMAISAKPIGIANAPRYAGIRPSSTVEQAINVLGSSATSNFVEVNINRTLYSAKNPKYQSMLKDLWLHGVACANASQLIATAAQLPRPNDVFFMGLMHNIGKLLLIQTISEIETMNTCEVETSPEQIGEVLKLKHGIFGRKLLSIWKLPQENGYTAQYHESPDQAPSVSRELYAVNLGNLLSKKIGYGSYEPKKDDQAISKSLVPLKLEPQDIDNVLAELSKVMKESGLSFD